MWWTLCAHSSYWCTQYIFSIHKFVLQMFDAHALPAAAAHFCEKWVPKLQTFKPTPIQTAFSAHNMFQWWETRSLLSQSCAKKAPWQRYKRWQRDSRWSESKIAHIICVDVPRHVPVRDELPVNVASDFAVPPAAVDVNYADHVPLREREEMQMLNI